MTALEISTTFAAPGEPGSPVEVAARYENFIGGEWTAPLGGRYRENVTPVTGAPFCEVAHSSAADVERALDAAHAAKGAWARPLAGRARRGAQRDRGRAGGEP
jgi:aldehyde dehydrogenase